MGFSFSPLVKVTLAIGGWNEGSTNYSQMAADAERRKRFIKSALEFLLRYKFDGLDLDWEYPSQRFVKLPINKKQITLVYIDYINVFMFIFHNSQWRSTIR